MTVPHDLQLSAHDDGQPSAPPRRATIVEQLERLSAERPEDRAYAFLVDGEQLSASLTYAQLRARAVALASELQRTGSARPALVLCPTGLEYVSSLLGCFYAGVAAVPAYPPTRTGLARTMPRIRVICEDCRPSVVLTTHAVLEVLRADPQLDALIAPLTVISVDALPSQQAEYNPRAPQWPPPAPSSVALLQYTSGSTSAPKGVLVTHTQLAGNAAIIEATSRLGPSDKVLSWLPPYHDMGLVGGILQPLFAGCLSILMPPDVFLRRPLRWLKVAGTWGATALLAPNFALDACVRRIDEDARRTLDLSKVRVVYIGAEPIRAQTLARFADAFAVSGLTPRALFPCYGMAEATLMITGGNPDEAPVIRNYDATALSLGRAVPVSEGATAEAELALVGCGHAVPGERILIVDPVARSACGEREVGEIWAQSEGVASGYFERPADTAHAFAATTSEGDGPWLRTGDLGFLDRGELFVTGRLKDLIIVRGRNHYPQDIENTVQALDAALTLDAGAAFSIDHASGEQLVIVQEVDKRSGCDPRALIERIPEAVRGAHDITPAAVVLIKRGSLGKTSSGKVQRRAARAAFLTGQLEVVERWQAPRAESSTPLAQDSDIVAADARSTRSRASQPSRRALEIEAWLRARVAEKLGIDERDIDPRETAARYGVDSALAAELIEDLQQWLDLRLDTTLSYDHPTIAGLARAVAGMTGAARMPGTKSDARLPASPPVASTSIHREPIAIVGMACRLPGAPSLESFWELLLDARDAITEVPRDRWDNVSFYADTPGTPGKLANRWGGFVDDIDRFDAEHFGISPHEAARMDPQQRMFLETAWEALEDAAIAPTALAGTRTGVFVGVCASDFALLHGDDWKLVDADYGTGSAPSIVANRLSYALDLKGPSEAIDSACSSSLSALHRACLGLGAGECEVAIVGGVNAVLAPEVALSFSQQGLLAPDGRCKAFEASADGFVRSEGVGALVLKPLSSALRERDRIYAVVHGSAVNHDGRSHGLSAPSGAAQREVIERALSHARVDADAIDYVEAHGVGTRVGDAVEVAALDAVFATQTRKRALMIGSVKTNVGHLEAASGVVSVIKVALALHHERLPQQVCRSTPSDAITGHALRLATTTEPWPRQDERARFAGASTFGFGGANSHVILGEAPSHASKVAKTRGESENQPQLLALSARTRSALQASVQRLSEHLEHAPDTRLVDVCFTANTGRAALGERLALVSGSTDALREQLLSFVLAGAAPRSRCDLVCGRAPASGPPRIALAFVEPEQGAVDPALGPAMLAAFPQAAAAFERAERAASRWLHSPLRRALWEGDEDERFTLLRDPCTQSAALMALWYSLHEVLVALGVEPVAVLGSGVGEHAAAAATGCLPWPDAIALAAQRAAVQAGLVPHAAQRITLHAARAEISALTRKLRAPDRPLLSACLNRPFADDERPDAAFWSQHLLATTAPISERLREALSAERVELVLDSTGAANLPTDACLTLWPKGARAHDLLLGIGALFVRGCELSLDALQAGSMAEKIALPTYPFERTRHWLDFPDRGRRPTSQPGAPKASGLIERPSAHPFAGRIRSSRPVSQSGFSTASRPPKASGDDNG